MNPIDIDAMVNRFLAWKLPANFAPDCGISFQAPSHPAIWPTGTNLLDATQAREMIGHILALRTPSAAPPAGSDSTDAARWRRLVNASEMPFPIATIADDPENDCNLIYGRARLERLIDDFDEIPDTYAAISGSDKEQAS